MINKIKSIDNFAVFNGFEWDNSVHDKSGNVQNFQNINIIYGRNYSGKTTLSRILRAMETGEISDKFENPSFNVLFADGTQLTETNLLNHGKKFRVFNDDFVRSNLRFIANPDDSIEPFAILGKDNNKIEEEIQVLEAELGSKETGKETGLYLQKTKAATEYTEAEKLHKDAENRLEKSLKKKAIDNVIGIKYHSERFGDQNYHTQKLKTDIKKVQSSSYRAPTEEELTQCENLIVEKTLHPISPFYPPKLNFEGLVAETEALVTKKINVSDKIEDLVKDALLNHWVNNGRTHHKDKRDRCAFCDNPISKDRWEKLEKHFDKESEYFEKDIDALIDKIVEEKNAANTSLSIDKSLFYSKFHNQLDELIRMLKVAVDKYDNSLEKLAAQLKARKEDILNQKAFENPDNCLSDLLTIWNKYELIRIDSNKSTSFLNDEQSSAKEALRLKEVSDFLITINYQEQFDSINKHKEKLDISEQNKNKIEGDIRKKEELISSKKRELNDEEKGAKKVNEYLNNFFGHQFLTLEAKKDEFSGEESKRIRFEVIRDGKKAHHLSEGECSLLAFCYFLAKLDDVNTQNSKPIIWIDDPISSLDGNHIFFVYSLLNAEIVAAGNFEQLFVSTHNLDFLKYLKRLNGKFLGQNGTLKDYQKGYFVVVRQDKTSTIRVMPRCLKEYFTEFNYLFHQIYKCAEIEMVDDTNYVTFYNFANNARKFLEIYLYYKYPDQGMNKETLYLFFGGTKIPAFLIDRINNEYSHLCGVLERGSRPVEVPEMRTAARQIIEKLKEDNEQYSALLRSIGVDETAEEHL